MNQYEFKLLPYERQLAAVHDAGDRLATRWEEEVAVVLYTMPGYFLVEVFYDTASNEIISLRSFRSAKLLEDYAAGIKLPDGLL